MSEREVTFHGWRDKLLAGLVGFAALCLTSYGGWSTIAIGDLQVEVQRRPTFDQVRQIVATDDPLNQHRHNSLSQIVEKNTEAINAMRVVLAKLETKLEQPN